MNGIFIIQLYIRTKSVRGCCKMTNFIEFAVIRDIFLCHSSDSHSLIDDDSAVVELTADGKGDSNYRNNVKISCFFDYPGSFAFCCA